MGRLFDIQPAWCREKLNLSRVRDFDNLSDETKRLVLFDPINVYLRLDAKDVINPMSRYNTVPISVIFPKPKNKICACGCERELTGRQTVWSSKQCVDLPLKIQTVISGHSHIRSLCGRIFGSNCSICGIKEGDRPHELDHKFPVKFGGAASWLSNYEFKCKSCHRQKTNADFGYKSKLSAP
jgi:5-methylcytosine-specific restriction endonuclease McrA